MNRKFQKGQKDQEFFIGQKRPIIKRPKNTERSQKAKKAIKRPKIANLTKRKGSGQKMVSQGPKQSYKMI